MKPNAYIRLTGRQFQFSKRVRGGKGVIVNLRTSDLLEARNRRDELLAKLAESTRVKMLGEHAAEWDLSRPAQNLHDVRREGGRALDDHAGHVGARAPRCDAISVLAGFV
jgi:hypothetical protein